MKWKNYHIEDVEINLMLNGLKERYGYDFSGYARASLKRRLMETKLYFEVNHLSELIPEMLYDESVAQTIINNISIPVSDFFRDSYVWEYIRNKVLFWLSGFPRINIWQVGCGRGEETYTLSILLHEKGLANRVRIFATDINPAFLEDANNGTWSDDKFESWKKNYESSGGAGQFDDYFIKSRNSVSIRDEYKKSIEFVQHNLVSDEVFREVQFVVCRNVLIYFGEALQDRAISLFTRSLERGGYLLLGRSESILNLQDTHPGLEEIDNHFKIFRKKIGDRYHV